jgi:hypothetical protein
MTFTSSITKKEEEEKNGLSRRVFTPSHPVNKTNKSA